MLEAFLIKLSLAAAVFFGVLNLAGLHTWIERKQSAIMQDRIGANRASIFGLRLFGLFHPLADVLKLFTKEDFIPPGGNRVLHTLAPFLSAFFALVVFAAIPIGNTLTLGGWVIELQVASLDIGLLYILAMLSMGVYGVVLAGYASNNHYAFLGGMRAASQMLSYEITMGISLIGLIMWSGTLDLQAMVRAQGQYLWGWLPLWGAVVQPVALIVFLAAALAETKRIPFDMPEGESEIVGYFVEYSGMKFGLFFMTDFIETVLVACLATTFFFGGWQVPYLFPDGFRFPWGGAIPMAPLAVTLAGIGAFTAKVVGFCWLFMTVRWTLPRFRYDQLMRLGWQYLFPISLANVVATGLALRLLS
ncbi:MAG: NADH-quinone oxidoreductase subunit H [Candidatus Omnitrophica bacterium]|nr:NADH-quinone oxidoreductase subunit H [Candidatus Omnitrophota bacterium]